jgi:hypothetical protein
MKLAVALLAAATALGIRVFAAYFNKQDFSELLGVLIFVCRVTAIVSVPLAPELSNRKLLSDGELAVGRAIHQETVPAGKNTWSAIFYAFADGANQGFIGNGQDSSDSLAKGAPIIVYYDSLEPDKNVAME